MKIINFHLITHTIYHVVLIFRRKNIQNKLQILFTYLRLRFKYNLLIKPLNLKINSENILGYRIQFPFYGTFIRLFEDIFIQQSYFLYTLKKRPFIIDCGSNIGMTILFFKKLFPLSRIIGFEPDKNNFLILSKNIKKNNLKNVKLFNTAVSNKEDIIDFFSVRDTKSFTINTQINNFHRKDIVNIKNSVKSVVLSNYISKKVDFLKLDIEGAEYLVMNEISSKNKLKYVDQIAMEFHHNIHSEEDNLPNMLLLLKKNGFVYQLSSLFSTSDKIGKRQNIIINAKQNESSKRIK